MTEVSPHLGLEYVDKLNPEFLAEFREKVYTGNLSHKEITRPSDMVYMSLEWMLPTAVVFYISKTYFDTFLKEAAKDHYKILKTAVSGLANKSAKEINMSLVASGDGKIGEVRVFSSSFSVMYMSDDTRTSFKFLFRDSATEDQIKEATNHFLDLLKDFNDNREESKLNELISKLDRRSIPIIVCYNEITREAMILKPENKVLLSDISNS